MESVSRNHNVSTPLLDRVKFLCREFWSKLFFKNMSRLQTNHKDMFVLTGMINTHYNMLIYIFI